MVNTIPASDNEARVFESNVALSRSWETCRGV